MKNGDVALPEFRIHPPVDEGVVGTAAHGQPVGRDPDHTHVAGHEDVGVYVAGDGNDVQGQPADGVDAHHCDHHLDNLQERGREKMR